MAKLFARYVTVGVLNTLIHWIIFAVCFLTGLAQALSNFIAFCVAVTFSFFVNARWTFRSEATTIRYMMYVFFMAVIAVITGAYADRMNVPPVATLIIFSTISLACGFIYSKYIIFRDKK